MEYIDKMRDKRLRKISDFNKFYTNCTSIFNNFNNENNNRIKRLQDLYMLTICPGSRAGGNENRIIEVFWGSRIYDSKTNGIRSKFLIEEGATLLFFRNDTGDITISLYPSKTEFRKPIEDSISLHEWIDPKKLNDEKFIRSLWNDFISYMEVTSIDGNPTPCQRLRVHYLRYFKHLVIDNKYINTKFSIDIKQIFKWVFTVGISGCIIYLFTLVLQPSSDETNKHLEKISHQLESIIYSNEKLKTISITFDSMNVE